VSKYRIEIKPSKYQGYFILSFYALCAVSVILWQPSGPPWQWLLQASLIIVLVVGAYYAWMQFRHNMKLRIVMLSDVGEWLYLDDENQAYWQMTHHCRITSLLLWVNLLPKLASSGRADCWLWIFRDQVSEQDYRRLCRIIVRQQSKSPGQAL
jgi:hypothetical protein